MKTFTKDELKQILENHLHWLQEDIDGWENMRADLSYTDLHNTDLCNADLRYADLNNADLNNAILFNADLCNAELRNAELNGADLCNADLRGANLRYADLRKAKNIPFIPCACPDFGSFIGYKNVRGYIVELEILADAKRCSATTRKCRCDKAKVLSIQNINGKKADIDMVHSDYDYDFIYKIGEIVKIDDFDENRWNECSTGIHFFISRQEAVD